MTNTFKPLIFITLGYLIASVMAVAAFADPGRIQPRDIATPLVPTALLRGDREFGGNGPIMDVALELSVGRQGRAIFATVHFRAEEDGGDRSTTQLIPQTFEVWRWTPAHGPYTVDRIVTRNRADMRVRSPRTVGFNEAIIGPGEDGAAIVRYRGPSSSFLRDVKILGDTLGDDISTDLNPHGDTSIREIRFNLLDVEWKTSL